MSPATALAALKADRDTLLGIAQGLSASQWESPSGCQGWTIKDVVSHLVQTRRCRASRLVPSRLVPSRLPPAGETARHAPTVTPEQEFRQGLAILLQGLSASLDGSVL